MKLAKLTALLFITCIFITGCDTSSDSPENLLNDNIIYDKDKNELYTFINKSLEGTTLILPKNSSEVGQINELDSNIIAFQKKEDTICCIGLKCLIGMGIATSIDAMVAGASLKLTNTPILLSILMIGIASFVMSMVGFWSGNFFKNLPSKCLEILGGVILIILALKAIWV